MKHLIFSLLIAATALPAVPVSAEEDIPHVLNIYYVRPFGIKSVADEVDKMDKPKNRLGTGFVILMGNSGKPSLPSKPNPEEPLGD